MVYVEETHLAERPRQGPHVTKGLQPPDSEIHQHVCSRSRVPLTAPRHGLSTGGMLRQVCSWETRDGSGGPVHSRTPQGFHLGLGRFHQPCLHSGSDMHCSLATLSAFSGSVPFSPNEILARLFPSWCLLLKVSRLSYSLYFYAKSGVRKYELVINEIHSDITLCVCVCVYSGIPWFTNGHLEYLFCFTPNNASQVARGNILSF